MSDRTRRSIRTLIQACPPALILGAIALWVRPLSAAEIALLTPALLAVSTFALNLLEDETGVALGPKK